MLSKGSILYILVCGGMPVRENTCPGLLACEVELPAPYLAHFLSPALEPGTRACAGP